MVFRKWGRLLPNDALTLYVTRLAIVNNFKYLGITLQPTTTFFRTHVQDRVASAIKAMYDIKNLHLLALDTAMSLFRAISTTVYGIEIVWERLKSSDFKRLEKVKASYLKKVLGVPRNTKSPLAYELTRETFFLEDKRLTYLLPSTGPYEEVLEERKEIHEDFYTTTTMQKRSWIKENQPQRPIIIKIATHGFHHKLCKTKIYHEPCESCLCGDQCDIYHILKCLNRVKSINEYSKN